MSDFQLEMAEIKKPIAASLTTLWQIRNLTVTRADRARTLSQRLLRAQRLADTLRSESNDIYSKTMLQRELLVNLNRTAFDLFSQVSEVSTDVYLRNMTEIVDSIVAVHNQTCKTLANEIQTLKIRYFARKNTTETQQLEVERLSIQFADVESLLDNLESTDYDVIHELENKIVEISESVETFLPLIEALNASLASQHLDISEAELRLTSLLQNIEELESL
ncbi:hypothetical protein EB796_020604 [Bugula neritina]|uniref:Uncharacterized protein n=1 Tax=Bugula neritina TaxID=10212 RepID=A0A7J7J4I2_BUGNE|nr:hypothetical protein EB796_020604 [Bugula neritina]